MSTTAPAANEVAVLEKQLAAAKKRAEKKTLAERLREARFRFNSNGNLANRAKMIVQKQERELEAYHETVRSRRALGFPAPPPLQRIDIFSPDDVRRGKEASRSMTPQEILEDARAQLAKALNDRDAAARDVAALEKEIIANPLWKKVRALLADVFSELIEASAAPPDITLAAFDARRAQLESLAAREDSILTEYGERLREAGMPELRPQIRQVIYVIVLPEHIRRDLENHFEVAKNAAVRLKANAENF